MTVGERIATARKMIGLTQQELEKAAGIPKTNICLIENGHREPSLKTFRKIVVALRVSADYLLEINVAKLWEKTQ